MHKDEKWTAKQAQTLNRCNVKIRKVFITVGQENAIALAWSNILGGIIVPQKVVLFAK